MMDPRLPPRPAFLWIKRKIRKLALYLQAISDGWVVPTETWKYLEDARVPDGECRLLDQWLRMTWGNDSRIEQVAVIRSLAKFKQETSILAFKDLPHHVTTPTPRDDAYSLLPCEGDGPEVEIRLGTKFLESLLRDAQIRGYGVMYPYAERIMAVASEAVRQHREHEEKDRQAALYANSVPIEVTG